jgi:hypothetical protein
MKITCLFACLFLINLPLVLRAQSEWVKLLGARNDNNRSGPFTKVDKQGNIFIAGKNELISFDNNSTSISGCYLTKLDSLGRLIWQRPIGDFSLHNDIIGLNVNDAGDAFVVVNTNQATTFFGQLSINFLGGSAIARYSSDGQLVWAKQLSISLVFTHYWDIDNLGNIYFISSRASTITENEYFLLKLSGSNGSELFSRAFIQYSSPFYTQLSGIVTDKLGNTYIGGNCKTESLFVGGQLVQISNGAFHLKLNPEGQVLWFKMPINRGDESPNDWRSGTISTLSIADDASKLYVLGSTAKNTRFNAAGLTNGDNTSFFARINANTGDFEWVNTLPVTISAQKILSEGSNTWLYLTKSSFHSDHTPLTLEGGKKVTIEPFLSGNGAISTKDRAYIAPINDATGELRPLSILSDETVYSYLSINQNRIIGVNVNLGKIYGQDSLYQLNTNKMFALFSFPKSLLTYQPLLHLDSLTAQGFCENSLVKINALTQNMRLGNRFCLHSEHVGQPAISYFALNQGRQVDTTRYPYLDILSLHHAYKVRTKARLCSSSPTWCSEPIDLIQATILLNDTTLCYGNSIEVKSAIGFNYQWTPTRLFQNPTASNNIIKPDTVVVVKLLSKTQLGCSRTDSVTITTVRPIFNLPDSVRLNCADFDDHLTLDASSKGGYHTALTYAWVNPVSDLSFTSIDNIGAILGTNPLYSSNANRQLTWSLPTLNVGDRKKYLIQLRFKPDVTFLGKKAFFSSQVEVNNSLIDANLKDNTDTINQVIRGSYDPNDKQVTPRGPNLGNQVLPSVDEYEFLIRFQNTGTDTAFTVVVRDTLTNEWNVASLRTIAASHPYKFNLEKNNIAIWTFRNILLPDSTTNEVQSHGFIKFTLKTKATPLSIGTVLTNTAGIYFDYNPPIITNQVRLNVVNKLTNAVFDIVTLAKVYPNPTSDNLIIDLIGDTQPTHFVVSNILGQVIKTAKFEGKNHNLDIQSLENGVYMLSIRQGERVQNMSFMIQR